MATLLPYLLSSAAGFVKDTLFGQTHTMFNLQNVIEELPAARDFFWYDRVAPENRPNYLYYLGKLITLFTMDHTFELYPYNEASYMKKYESFFGDTRQFDSFVTQLFKLLSVNITTVQLCYPRPREKVFFLLENQTARLIEPRGYRNEFDHRIREWYSNPESKPVLLMDIGTNRFPQMDQQHANLLVLKKTESEVKYFWFDPHGVEHESQDFKRKLNTRLNSIVAVVPVIEVLTACPNLQTYYQGNNCVQWVAMILCMLCLHPKYFDLDNIEGLFQELGKHPELNMLIFELSFFLRTLPFFKLRTIHDAFFKNFGYEENENELWRSQIRDESLEESKVFKNFLYRHLQETNCSEFTPLTCPIACSNCKGTCSITAGVKYDKNGRCDLLTSKEIAKEMVEMFFKIKQLTHTLSSEEDKLNVQDLRYQVDSFDEVTHVQEYVEKGYITLQKAYEIQDIYDRNTFGRVRSREEQGFVKKKKQPKKRARRI